MATLFTDNFNSYADGNLDGQGSWTKRDGAVGDFQVQGTTVYEGAKGVSVNNKGANYSKTGTARTDGAITVYFKYETGADTDLNNRPGFRLSNSTTTYGYVSYNANSDLGGMYYHNGAAYVQIDHPTVNAWQYIQMEWRSSDHKFRFNLNGGTWTSWDTGLGGTGWTNIDTLYLSTDTEYDCWFDTIDEGVYVAPSSSIKNIIGLAVASVKNVNGLAIASVKSFDGLA